MFKVGDRVRIKSYCTHCLKGEICTLHCGARDGSDEDRLYAWGKQPDANCSCKDNWELVGKEATMENSKFGIRFEETSDPVEFFKTQKEAEARINELLDKASVNKKEIYLFEVGKVWKVERPITFKLVELVNKVKGRGRPKLQEV